MALNIMDTALHRTPASGLLLLALAIGGVVYSAYTSFVQRRERLRITHLHGCKTPVSYPHKRFMYGLDFLFETRSQVLAHRFTAGVHERFVKYGPTFVSHILFGRIINTIDPENLECAFKTDFDSWTIIPNRALLVADLFGRGIFANEGSEWKHSRNLVRRGMVNLGYQPEILERHFRELIHKIRLTNGESFDFAPESFEYSLNIAKDLLVGSNVFQQVTDTNKSDENTADQFDADFRHVVHMSRVLTVFHRRVPYIAYFLFWRTYTSTKQRLYDIVDRQVSRALDQQDQKEEGQQSLLERLTRQTRDVPRIRSEILNMLLGGRDSVGITLSETVNLLARHPEVWEKLRNEVLAVCSDRVPTHAELKSMTYLNHVVQEALRFRPTLAVHGRRALRATYLPRGGGHDGREPIFVRKGTWLAYSNYALHRNPTVFGADTDCFRPERWDVVAPKTYEYLSFGAGYRSCPGKQMAMTVLLYATARLAQTVRSIEPRDDRPWQESIAFSFFNMHGVNISMQLDGNASNEKR